MIRILLVVVILVSIQCHAYQNGVPPVTRKALAGLWKLTPSVRSMKEFTVHPRKPPKVEQDEVLLMLKEDGSFIRYETTTTTTAGIEDDDENDATTTQTSLSSSSNNVDQSWKSYLQNKRHNTAELPIKALFKGTWDYRDGSLILAADRDEQKLKSDTPSSSNNNNQQFAPHNNKNNHLFWNDGKDTILVGAVVATQNSFAPAVPRDEEHPPTKTAGGGGEQNLSVPMGSVLGGRFFYPKHHPSFFDQPMYQPHRCGTFQLKQVLGSASSSIKDEPELVEKFRNKDFHNKLFFVTSSPLEPRRPKGNVRWSIKYNKYVEDPPPSSKKKDGAAQEEDPNRPVVPIRVMKVMIHANNTFSTLAGLGDTTILRGRFTVIGDQRDQVWMQSVRFGFGRSVSGSTYSEGNALGEETKSYWGKISYQDDDDDNDDDNKDNSLNNKDATPSSDNNNNNNNNNNDDDNPKKRRLQVKGSVIVGWGLEPQPVARFIMREAEDDTELLEDDDDDDDDDEDEDGGVDEPDEDKRGPTVGDEEGIDDGWSNDHGSAFQ